MGKWTTCFKPQFAFYEMEMDRLASQGNFMGKHKLLMETTRDLCVLSMNGGSSCSLSAWNYCCYNPETNLKLYFSTQMYMNKRAIKIVSVT